jgi:hypothetical protein
VVNVNASSPNFGTQGSNSVQNLQTFNSNQAFPSFTQNNNPDFANNKNFFNELKALDQGTLSANDFFMKNINVFKKVYDFTMSNSVNIQNLKNHEIAAIVICLYELGKLNQSTKSIFLLSLQHPLLKLRKLTTKGQIKQK